MDQTLPRGLVNRLLEAFKSDIGDITNILETAVKYLVIENREPGDLPEQEIFALVVCCYAEASKLDLSSDDLRGQLEKGGLMEKHCETVVDVYEKYKADLRKSFLRIGWHPPHVLHANWKLCHHVKGSVQGSISKPTYMISLKLQDCDSPATRDLTFNCSVEQLQDMVWNLKEATRTIQKAAHQTM